MPGTATVRTPVGVGPVTAVAGTAAGDSNSWNAHCPSSDLRASGPNGSGTCMGNRPSDTTSGSAQGAMAPMWGSTKRYSCTQTGVPTGTNPVNQMKSMAWVLRRTHPCEAG